ncbi:hypothetical protein D3C74_363590 [compost metagenome]
MNTPETAMEPKASKLTALMPILRISRAVKVQASRYPSEFRDSRVPSCISSSRRSLWMRGMAGPLIFSEKPKTRKPTNTVSSCRI